MQMCALGWLMVALPADAGVRAYCDRVCRGGYRRHRPALAAYRQKSGIHFCGTGLSAAT